MRGKFDEQLEMLNTQLIEMGAMCESSIACAIKALLENNMEYAKRAIAMDEEIDQRERDIEALCLKLLLQQQPVARDLRQISSALKMITDMERIGDQAADIAEITTMGGTKPEDDMFTIREMAMAAIGMVTNSIDAYVKRDLELARRVLLDDDVVDAYFAEIRTQLAQHLAAYPMRAEYAIDLLMIAKYLERIADHATNIAEWVIFAITGRHEGEDHGNDLPG